MGKEIHVDNYIVRIYRREKDGAGTFSGIVEEVSTAAEKSFKSVNELCSILLRGNLDRVCAEKNEFDWE